MQTSTLMHICVDGAGGAIDIIESKNKVKATSGGSIYGNWSLLRPLRAKMASEKGPITPLGLKSICPAYPSDHGIFFFFDKLLE